MSFLHSEFLFWLLVPTLLLFYFWLTQKPLHHRWLSEAMLERLKAPENTMNLKGRNILFLIASVLLIVAMAQPVVMNSTPIRGGLLHIVMAIETGGDAKIVEKNREMALQSLYTLLGEEVELIAYDQTLYTISPRSNDGGILAELIRNLKPSAQASSQERVRDTLLDYDADMKIIVSSEALKQEGILSVSGADDIDKVHETLLDLREKHRLQAHIPLFYYPLGLAMVLMLVALASMSKRSSVSVASLVVMIMIDPTRSEAGILDFQLLSEAKSAYEIGDYAKSERLYARYQMSHDSPEVRYNRANALYMSGRFEKAAYWYGHVYTTDTGLLEKTRHNLRKTQDRLAEEKKGKEKGGRVDNSITQSTHRIQSGAKSPHVTRLFVW